MRGRFVSSLFRCDVGVGFVELLALLGARGASLLSPHFWRDRGGVKVTNLHHNSKIWYRGKGFRKKHTLLWKGREEIIDYCRLRTTFSNGYS
jgi:hypothetical protein